MERTCRQIRSVTAAVFLAAVVVAACKSGGWQKSDRDNDRQAAGMMVQPRRTGTADANSVSPVVFEVDAKTGQARQGLVLRLDYFPENETGGANLPACYGAFGRDFELGIFLCDGQPEKSQTLRAGHIFQDCYTNPRFERVPAATPITMQGCSLGLLKMHAFDPQLRIDIEQM